jgi:hypothetical protein
VRARGRTRRPRRRSPTRGRRAARSGRRPTCRYAADCADVAQVVRHYPAPVRDREGVYLAPVGDRGWAERRLAFRSLPGRLTPPTPTAWRTI